MNLDELQSAQSRERQTDSLQQLRDSFYEEAGEFIEELRDQRDYAAERADSPFDDPEVSRLTDDIQTAEQTVEAIYERRVGKIVKMASLAAADMPAEEEGLTREESDLFETLVEAIEQNREHVLAVLAGEADDAALDAPVDRADSADTAAADHDRAHTEVEPDQAPADGQPEPGHAADAPVDQSDSDAPVDPSDAGATRGQRRSDDTSPDPSGTDARSGKSQSTDETPTQDQSAPPVDAADLMGGDDGSTDEESTATDDSGGADVDRRMVRITDDVGTILGVDDREYDLSSDDVVRLPAANAGPLVESDAAEPLE